METLETLLIVVQVVAFLSIAALAMFLISYIGKMVTSLQNMQKDINTLTQKASPIFDNLEITTKRINNVTENIENQIDAVIYSINSVKKIADDIVEFEQKIQRRIEEPVLDAVGFISAVVKGVKTFFNRLRE